MTLLKEDMRLHPIVLPLAPAAWLSSSAAVQSDVGMFRVDAQQLKAALLPSPTALLAQLGQLLPQAASQLYNNFIQQVHSAISILKAGISSVEDYVHQLAFLQGLKVWPVLLA